MKQGTCLGFQQATVYTVWFRSSTGDWSRLKWYAISSTGRPSYGCNRTTELSQRIHSCPVEALDPTIINSVFMFRFISWSINSPRPLRALILIKSKLAPNSEPSCSNLAASAAGRSALRSPHPPRKKNGSPTLSRESYGTSLQETKIFQRRIRF